MRKTVFLIGPPGCGKGTQVEFLKKAGFVAVSMSEELRKRTRSEEVMSAGGEVECPTVIQALKERLKEIQEDQHVAVDGFPRTLVQVTWLVEESGYEPKFIVLDADAELCQKRVRHRRLQTSAQGGAVRKDDDADTHTKRLNIHHNRYDAIERYLLVKCRQDAVEHISAAMPPELIAEEIINILFPVRRSTYA